LQEWLLKNTRRKLPATFGRRQDGAYVFLSALGKMGEDVAVGVFLGRRMLFALSSFSHWFMAEC